jgi:HNH endonuclease
MARPWYSMVRLEGSHRLVRLHRVIAARTLGRCLLPSEVVHHVDGNPRNNAPENLLVLPTQGVHMALEWFDRREASGVQHLFDSEEWIRLYALSQRPK